CPVALPLGSGAPFQVLQLDRTAACCIRVKVAVESTSFVPVPLRTKAWACAASMLAGCAVGEPVGDLPREQGDASGGTNAGSPGLGSGGSATGGATPAS